MKLFIKIILPFIILSCSSRDIKISKYALINKEDQYENNYLSDEKKSIKKSKNKEMKILLNAEQFKKYKENEEKRNKEKLKRDYF